MIYAEYVLSGSFNVIETEILTKLDRLVRDPIYRYTSS
jgi:hypothetical protein